MPRLLLVNVVDRDVPGFSDFRISRIPPLGLAYLAAVSPPHWDVRMVDENFQSFRIPEGTDLVGLSAMTPDIDRAYRLAAVARGQGIPAVMGGVHVSMLPDEALRYADTVVIGEAESVWPQVLEDFERGTMAPKYEGKRLPPENLPRPRRDLFPPEYRTATVQTARGCPMHCEFCSVTRFNGGRYRTRPVDDVIEELAGIEEKAVFFVDDNLFGRGRSGRDRAIALFRRMVEQKIEKFWWGQTGLEHAHDHELLAWASRSGCRLLLVGFESVSECALEEMGKHANLKLSPSNYRKAISNFHAHGIAVWGCFIFGSDEDTRETLNANRRFLEKSGLDVTQITALTPLPGTRLYERLAAEGRIRYASYPEDWRRYCFLDCMIEPRRMSAEELNGFLHAMRRRYWGAPFGVLRRTLATLVRTRRFTTALSACKMNRSFRTMYRHHYSVSPQHLRFFRRSS